MWTLSLVVLCCSQQTPSSPCITRSVVVDPSGITSCTDERFHLCCGFAFPLFKWEYVCGDINVQNRDSFAAPALGLQARAKRQKLKAYVSKHMQLAGKLQCSECLPASLITPQELLVDMFICQRDKRIFAKISLILQRTLYCLSEFVRLRAQPSRGNR